MKRLLEKILRLLAKNIIRKYKPSVVGITGSVGKTSTKEAIFAVLSQKFNVRRSEKNYNNELGVPLSIIGLNSAGKSMFGWLKIFAFSLWKIIIFDKKFPKILILEMGIDRPGDMDYLNSIVKSQVAVVTSIGQAHLEFFGDIKEIQKEKGKLVKQLTHHGWAIVNYDDELTKEMSNWSQASVLTYGLDKQAQINASNINWLYDQKRKNGGVSFDLNFNGKMVPVILPHSFGQAVVYSSLAAAAVGLSFEMSLDDIAVGLFHFVPAKGRMNILAGINNSLIIDDTYNSSPQSVESAINALCSLSFSNQGRTWAVLGDMLELGKDSEEKHHTVGKLVASQGINYLVVVGELSKNIAMGAKSAGMPVDKIFMADNSDEAGKILKNNISSNDNVLVKASQGVRLERCVELILDSQISARDVLVRQDDEWK